MSEDRRNSLGQAATGAALYGVGEAGNKALDARLKRRKVPGTFRAASQGKLKLKVHGPQIAGRMGVRGIQGVGLPLLAYGAYNAARAKPHPTEAVDPMTLGTDVVRHATYQDQVDRGRERVGKTLTEGEKHRLDAQRAIGRTSSLVSGTLGLTALGLRAPGGARALANRGVKGARLVRLAGHEGRATGASNTLGIGAIGVGSAGSFNYAAQQKLERKRDVVKAVMTPEQAERRKHKAQFAVAAGGATLLAHPTGLRVSTLRAMRNASRLQGHRAAGIAEDLARVPHSAPSKVSQRVNYLQMKAKNPDVKYVRPTADRWSRTFAGVSNIKRADPDTPIRARDVLLHPNKARSVADARVVRNLLDAAPAQRRALHRVTFYGGQGKVVDSSTPTSWSTDPKITQSVQHYQERRRRVNGAVSRLPGARRAAARVIPGEPRTVSLPPGAARSINLSAATPTFRQSEHIARVDVDKAHQDAFLRRYGDRISPDAERGYRTLKHGRNDQVAQGVGQGVLAGLAAGVAGHEFRAVPRNRLTTAAAAAGAVATTMSAVSNARGAARYHQKMGKIKAKARSRQNAGLYGPGRGLTPVDTTSARARNLAKAMGVPA